MEKLRRFIMLCVYMFAPPFYMMSVAYLLADYSGREKVILTQVLPFLGVTVWIPLVASLCCNALYRHYKQKKLVEGENLKDYPLIFIFIYSLYFFLMSNFFWGADCLYSAISGMMLVAFVLIFRENTRRCVEYLPLRERFYFYAIAFLFPVLIVMMSDVLSLIENTPWHMTILLSPISYIAGVSVFACACQVLKAFCTIKNIALKKHLFSLRQGILLLLVGDVVACLYLILYVGQGVFLTGLSMSITLYMVEMIYDLNRKYKIGLSTTATLFAKKSTKKQAALKE